MPRYFFDTTDGDRDTDDLGIELDDDHAAMCEAVRYAGALIADQPTLLEHGELKVTAHTGDGATVARVRVELVQP